MDCFCRRKQISAVCCCSRYKFGQYGKTSDKKMFVDHTNMASSQT